MFQSTLPHGERLSPTATWLHATRFNPRSRMGSDFMWACMATNLTGFNPRSRMGSDVVPNHEWFHYNVSIHAPAWGATRGGRFIRHRNLFQSTLPHGERPGRAVVIKSDGEFQSTLPHGERRDRRERQRRNRYVSIHAPAWGATVC